MKLNLKRTKKKKFTLYFHDVYELTKFVTTENMAKRKISKMPTKNQVVRKKQLLNAKITILTEDDFGGFEVVSCDLRSISGDKEGENNEFAFEY